MYLAVSGGFHRNPKGSGGTGNFLVKSGEFLTRSGTFWRNPEIFEIIREAVMTSTPITNHETKHKKEVKGEYFSHLRFWNQSHSSARSEELFETLGGDVCEISHELGVLGNDHRPWSHEAVYQQLLACFFSVFSPNQNPSPR